MSTEHKTHDQHAHTHGPNCGHKTVEHDGHEDFLHDGHLHHLRGTPPHPPIVEEHTLSVGGANPAACTPSHDCSQHDRAHQHGAGCGHDAITHGDHTDYIVDGHLHHAHGSHCDDHGPVKVS